MVELRLMLLLDLRSVLLFPVVFNPPPHISSIAFNVCPQNDVSYGSSSTSSSVKCDSLSVGAELSVADRFSGTCSVFAEATTIDRRAAISSSGPSSS